MTGKRLLTDHMPYSLDDFRERVRSHLPPHPDQDFGDHHLNPEYSEMVRKNATSDAAVLIGVTGIAAEPMVILTQRSPHLRTHSGQVAFPGGRIDPGDASPEAAAIRECQEETGIGPEHVETIGRLPDYHSGSGFRIVPVLAVITEGYTVVPNPAEVDEVFEVPLGFLMDEVNHRRGSKRWKGARRHFYEMPYGDRYIWGVTAGIIRMMYERLYA